MTATTTLVLPNGSVLRVEQELVDVTTNLPEPDPAWVFTDAAGHLHTAGDPVTWPTLQWVVTEARRVSASR